MNLFIKIKLLEIDSILGKFDISKNSIPRMPKAVTIFVLF